MKKVYILVLLVICASPLKASSGQVYHLMAPEQKQLASQDIIATATLKSASRLFASKDDLTSVILIIPADSVVSVLDSDSTYFHVFFDETEGYIFKRDAVLNKIPVNRQQVTQTEPAIQETEPVIEHQESRYSYLENKYGSTMAARLLSGKIWKGMDSEMVKDSWGVAEKINRVISGNIIKEEWIYRNTWLYFENNTLLEWGPVKQ